jgi:hypothetical protein
MEAVPTEKTVARPEKVDKAEKADEKKPRKPSRSKRPRVVAVEPEPAERPVLVALPQPQPQERRGPRAVPSAKKRAPAPVAPARRPGHGKAKRELPPYLRVVK